MEMITVKVKFKALGVKKVKQVVTIKNIRL